MKHLFSGLCLVFALLCPYVRSGRILILSVVSSHSHSLYCNKLAQLLSQRGHQVTFLDGDAPRNQNFNYTTYTLEGGFDFLNMAMTDLDSLFDANSSEDVIDALMGINADSCPKMLSSPGFKRFMADQKGQAKPFDLIIHDLCTCECFLGLVPTLGHPKVMAMTAFSSAANVPFLMGSYSNPAYSPYPMGPYDNTMSLKERMHNLYLTGYFLYKWKASLVYQNRLMRQVLGESLPSIQDISRNLTVALVNTHPLLDSVAAYMPSVIPVPGFHIDEPKPLKDKKMQNFLDTAPNGVVLMSLGSNLKSSDMTPDKKRIFLNVFRRLKQRVLWKFEENIADLPENVMISKWVPQNDVLGHPNVKIFLSHCGLLGSQESIYHGVQLICIPFMFDQHTISQRLERKGLVISVNYRKITEASLFSAIEEIQQSRFTSLMQRSSKLFKDGPMKPQDLAIFWVEYILENDHFEHLKSPALQLTLCQLLMFDVIAVLLAPVIIVALLVFFILKKKYSSNEAEKHKLNKKMK